MAKKKPTSVPSLIPETLSQELGIIMTLQDGELLPADNVRLVTEEEAEEYILVCIQRHWFSASAQGVVPEIPPAFWVPLSAIKGVRKTPVAGRTLQKEDLVEADCDCFACRLRKSQEHDFQ